MVDLKKKLKSKLFKGKGARSALKSLLYIHYTYIPVGMMLSNQAAKKPYSTMSIRIIIIAPPRFNISELVRDPTPRAIHQS